MKLKIHLAECLKVGLYLNAFLYKIKNVLYREKTASLQCWLCNNLLFICYIILCTLQINIGMYLFVLTVYCLLFTSELLV